MGNLDLMSGFIGAILGSIIGAFVTGIITYSISQFEVTRKINEEIKVSLMHGLKILNSISLLDITSEPKAWEFNNDILKFQSDLSLIIYDDEYRYIKEKLLEILDFVKNVHIETWQWKDDITINYLKTITGKEYNENIDYTPYLLSQDYKTELIFRFKNNQTYFINKKKQFTDMSIMIIKILNSRTTFSNIFQKVCQDFSKV